MPNCGTCNTMHLPDILMYGGDATPWKVRLMTASRTPVSSTDVNGASAELAISRYGLVSGLGGDAVLPEPDATVDGSVETDENGNVYVFFSLDPGDTEELRGKYLYQITIDLGDGPRVCQGVLTIKPNINR